ncbi:Protease [Minicystis rosea]|nr:Protease [Minicystis rosea]
MIVTMLHEEEQSLAAQHLTSVRAWGESLCVGEMDDAGIDTLREAGLIVEVIPSDDDLRAQGFLVPHALSNVASFLPMAPATVALVTYGPILPEWVQRLSALGVRRVDRAGGDRLRIRVEDDATLREIASLDWVIGIRGVDPPRPFRLPTAGEEPDDVPFSPDGSPIAPGPDIERPWDVRVRDGMTAEDVTSWANQNGIAILGSSARRVRLGVTSAKEPKLADLDELGLEVTLFIPPTWHNDCARAGIGIPIDARVRVGAADVTLTGRDQIVAVADSGLDDAHPDFAGRIARVIARGRPGNASDPHGHGTHVSGTILGSGAASAGRYRGIAPEARLVFQSILDGLGGLGGLPVDLGDLFAEALAQGARIHNNSWGSAVQSRYTGTSEDVDAFVAAHPEMLVVLSAGNEGTTLVDNNVPAHLEPGLVQPLSLGAPATSKNALVVGAVRSSRVSGGLAQRTYATVFPQRFPLTGKPADVAADLVSGDPEQLAGFSSRGPCDDRRIKPDVVAPGTDIVSTRSALAPSSHFAETLPEPYGYMSGTSMAAPVVTGLAVLVREYYVRHRNVEAPSAALLKATIINGTRVLTGGDAGGPVPNPHQGFGCVDLTTTLPTGDGVKLAFLDVPATEGFTKPLDRRRFTFVVAAPGEVRICLAFIDPPARGLQNDLDIIVEGPGTPRRKILGNADLRGRLTAEDCENNAEIVRIGDAAPGTWLISIRCRNLIHGPQGFALVVRGPLRDEILASA